MGQRSKRRKRLYEQLEKAKALADILPADPTKPVDGTKTLDQLLVARMMEHPEHFFVPSVTQQRLLKKFEAMLDDPAVPAKYQVQAARILLSMGKLNLESKKQKSNPTVKQETNIHISTGSPEVNEFMGKIMETFDAQYQTTEVGPVAAGGDA